MSRTLMESHPITQIPRYPEGMQMSPTTSPREGYLRNEEYLELQEEVLRSLGIPSGQQSSRSLHPSPSSSPDVEPNNRTPTQPSCETSNTWQIESGLSHQLCINPDGHIFLAYPSPLNNGRMKISSP
uniref:C3 n=1 Tax=Capulavirus medicagonis TaxID=1306546 RepID=A0A3G3BIT6_9GEMI|nr:C3 [Alfalfa leaf curl virus]